MVRQAAEHVADREGFLLNGALPKLVEDDGDLLVVLLGEYVGQL